MRKILLIIILPIAVIIGIKFYLASKTEALLDDAITLASPFVDVSYGHVSSNLSGEVFVDNIYVSPKGSFDELTISRITFKTELIELLKMYFSGKSNQLPNHASLSIQSLTTDVDSEFLKDLEAQDQAQENSADNPFDALACGGRDVISLADIKTMGYSSLTSNVNMGYHIDSKNHELIFNFYGDTEDMYSMDVDIAIEYLSKTLQVADPALLQPTVKAIDLIVNDLGYNNRRNTFCATENEQSIEENLKSNTAKALALLKKEGLIPNTQIIEAYEKTLKPESTIFISLAPRQGLDMQQAMLLSQYSTNEMVDALGLSVVVNGKAISDLTVLTEQQQSTLLQRSAEEEAEVNADRQQKILEESNIYRDVAHSEINNFISYPVFIKTKDHQKEFRGKLLKINNDALFLSIEMGTGAATIPIRFDDIEILQVKYRATDQ